MIADSLLAQVSPGPPWFSMALYFVPSYGRSLQVRRATRRPLIQALTSLAGALRFLYNWHKPVEEVHGQWGRRVAAAKADSPTD